MRHHTAPNLYFKFSELKDEPNYYPPIYKDMDWSNIFINSNPPDILDIGCGKGLFLLNMSEAFPDSNILGIELRKPAVEWINQVSRGENIANAAAIWYSVVNGLDFIESDSIEKVFYLFPDPWTKRKHLKRRAFNLDLLNDVYRVLKKNGQLYLATDLVEVDVYHKKILDKFSKFDYKIVENSEEWQFPETNKENFCIRESIAYYRIICKKS